VPNQNEVQYKPYDICVITAANEHQAEGYRLQLQWRKDRGTLPEETEFLVYADPQGKRIGSGGSTVYVLYKILERFYEPSSNIKDPISIIQNKRILILHSGGDSKRLPAYSAVGKIFIPLPTSFRHNYGQKSKTAQPVPQAACLSLFHKNSPSSGLVALFDIILGNLIPLPCLNSGQLVIASGDTLLSFDPSEVSFSDSGITGLSYPGPVEVASKHGVYITSRAASKENLREVTNFLQKPDYDELKESNGLDVADRAFVDTGVMNFGVDAIDILMRASGISLQDGKVLVEKGSLCEGLINANVKLDIYEEIPFGMLDKNYESYDKSHARANLSSFMKALRDIPFFVCLLPYCEFFHIGTSKQLIQNFHIASYTASVYGFQNFNNAKVIDNTALSNAFVYNSVLNNGSLVINGKSFIEGCFLEGKIHLGGENVLTGIPKGSGDINLKEGVCVSCVPIDNGEKYWVAIIYGIEDDFKKSAEDDSATFLNGSFKKWMEDRGISVFDLWSNGEYGELWDAKLFTIGNNIVDSIRISLDFQDKSVFQTEIWRNSPRMSLQEILRTIDYETFVCNFSNLIGTWEA